MDRENIKRGSFLKQIRTANRISERDLAEMLDVETSDIAVWETGIKFPEDSATIEKLAKIFHVTKREILTGEYKKERVPEIEHDNKKYEDYTLSNTGKNILIVALSCVILLILFISIFSVSNSINKKVPVDISQYYVSDEREEVIHTPKSYTESIVRNTVVMSSNRPYNPDILLNYGFVKTGNKYVGVFNGHRIEFQDEVFKFYYKSGSYHETYVKHIDKKYMDLYVKCKNYEATFEHYVAETKDCTQYTCKNTTDYLRYINFLSQKVRE